jgi:Fanconi anemia group M protein
MKKQKLKIIADHREAPSGVLETLQGLGVEVETRQLAVGDFVISQRVAVERKSVGDFLQSMVDGRLLSQARLLREAFERPVLILEGKEIYKRRAIHPNAIRGALAALAVDMKIPVIPAVDDKETALLLVAMAKREQAEGLQEVALHKKPRELPLPEYQRFVVEGLPGISAVLAKRLLEHFKTVEKIVCASEEDLRKVHGIGKVKAKRIRELLSAAYEPHAPNNPADFSNLPLF